MPDCGYEFYLLVSRVSEANEWDIKYNTKIKFISMLGHVIFSIYNEIKSDWYWYPRFQHHIPWIAFHLFTIGHDRLFWTLAIWSRTTFRFPWEFLIAGFNCISWHYGKNIFGGKNGFKTVQFYWMNSTSPLQSGNKQTRKHNGRLVHSWPNVVCFCSSKNTFTQLHYLKFQNCCWNDNYKNRKQSWVFQRNLMWKQMFRK